jgi:hypothetical protein
MGMVTSLIARGQEEMVTMASNPTFERWYDLYFDYVMQNVDVLYPSDKWSEKDRIHYMARQAFEAGVSHEKARVAMLLDKMEFE